jgi:hypothetical protein
MRRKERCPRSGQEVFSTDEQIYCTVCGRDCLEPDISIENGAKKYRIPTHFRVKVRTIIKKAPSARGSGRRRERRR